MHGGNLIHLDNKSDDDQSNEEELDRGTLALFRIVMNVLGVAVFIFVEMVLWPKSARRLIYKHEVDALKCIGEGMVSVMSPFLAITKKTSENQATNTEEKNSDPAEQPESVHGIEMVTAKPHLTSHEKEEVVESDGVSILEDGVESSEVVSEAPTHPSIALGLKAVTKALELVDVSDGEPNLWQHVFPTQDYRRLLTAEKKCFELLHFMKDTAEDAADADALPISVPPAMVLYSLHVMHASKETLSAWEDTHGLEGSDVGHWSNDEIGDKPKFGHMVRNSSVKEGECHEDDTFASASTAATPFLCFQHSTAQSLIDQRDALIDLSFTVTDVPSQRAILGWMATCFLCQETAVTVNDMGGGLRDVIAKQSPLS